MGKLANWESKLADYLASCANKDFQWGKFDCIHFAVGAERAMCGSSNLDEFDSIEYSTEEESKAALVALGATSLYDFIDKYKQRVDRLMIKRGDWVAFHASYGFAVGVWDGRNIWAASDGGITNLSLDHAIHGWKI